MSSTGTRSKSTAVQFEDPPFAKALFGSTAWSWLWLIVRLYMAYRWLTSGIGKLSNPAWTQTGEALKGFWTNAVRVPELPAKPPISFDWYRSFLEALLAGNHYVWFSKLVVAGEILIGVTLLLGLFTGIAALFGAFMNWNFMMAGTASINPVLFPLAMLLVLAWKTAGWWGLDRWVLPALGTPWRPGTVFRADSKTPSPEVEPKRSPV